MTATQGTQGTRSALQPEHSNISFSEKPEPTGYRGFPWSDSSQHKRPSSQAIRSEYKLDPTAARTCMVPWPSTVQTKVCRAARVFILKLLQLLVLVLYSLEKVKQSFSSDSARNTKAFHSLEVSSVVGVVIAQQIYPRDLEKIALLLSWYAMLMALWLGYSTSITLMSSSMPGLISWESAASCCTSQLVIAHLKPSIIEPEASTSSEMCMSLPFAGALRSAVPDLQAQLDCIPDWDHQPKLQARHL